MREKLADNLVKLFLLIASLIVLIYNVTTTPVVVGEWDDYTLPAISIINDHNFSIVDSDVQLAKEYFPEWASELDHYSLSTYTARDGGEMAWYFPTYSIACLPMILLLKFLKIQVSYAFIITNWILYTTVLWITYHKCKLKKINKFFLLAILAVNPILFYIGWPSAETLIFSLIAFTMQFWLNGNRKLAALSCSIAGTLNPTILILGIVMILDFLIEVFKNYGLKQKNIINKIVNCILKEWRKVISYGAIYIIALIPMVYNYYNMGHINLTASIDGFTIGTESTFSRFIAYITDLNFGILPYYGLILIMSVSLAVFAVAKRNWKYLSIFVSFFMVVYAFSFMIHINCGMSGIARYCAWSIVLLLYAVFYFYETLFVNKILINIAHGISAASIIILAITIYNYGPVRSIYTDPISMTPRAQLILNNEPQLYNPLGSTFNARINHIDGGYNYETPIYYTDNFGIIRKILVTKDDVELVKKSILGTEEEMIYLDEQLAKLGSDEQYINFGKKYSLVANVNIYELGSSILFYSEDDNANDYFVRGLSNKEDGYTWTDGNLLILRFRTDDSNGNNLQLKLDVKDIFNNSQTLNISCNEETVKNVVLTGATNLDITLPKSKSNYYNVTIELPDAVSPRELGVSQDDRKLGIMLTSAKLEEK